MCFSKLPDIDTSTFLVSHRGSQFLNFYVVSADEVLPDHQQPISLLNALGKAFTKGALVEQIRKHPWLVRTPCVVLSRLRRGFIRLWRICRY